MPLKPSDIIYSQVVGEIHRLARKAQESAWPSIYIDAAISLTTDWFTFSADKKTRHLSLKAFELVETLLKTRTYPDELAKDAARQRILQALISKHFQRALREARRSDTRTRFVWTTQRGTLRLLMPRTITGPERREWLERNISQVDPSRPGEKERVQAIIDALLGVNPLSIDAENAPILVADIPHPAKALEQIDSQSLGECVAQEKADSLLQLRPAVRKLGSKTVRELVIAIFEHIDQGTYHESDLARRFHLDTATFSRFAGLRWKAAGRVPDLWRNLAQLLMSHERFQNLCQDAGVWSRIQTIVSPSTTP